MEVLGERALKNITAGLKAQTTEPELIPRGILFGNPEKANPQISPDGLRMAYLAPVDDKLNVWVKTIGKDDDRPVTHDTVRGIFMYFWAKDNKHVMYLQDSGGNENWLLYAVNLETNEVRALTPFDKVQVNIIKRSKHYPNELIIAMNKDDERFHDIYHLDVPTGELRMVAKNPGNVLSWLGDRQFKMRGAMLAQQDGSFEFVVRETEESPWKSLVTWGIEDNLTSHPLGFTKDGKSVYLADSRGMNAGRLIKMHIETGAIEEIISDPEYDINDVMIHPDTYEIQAVNFMKARGEWVILDPNIKEDFANIRKLHDGDFYVYDRDDADVNWLVAFISDNGPATYYSYNRTLKTSTFLFVSKPALLKYTMAHMNPFHFTARDGLTVHGYLTFPPGKPLKNLPLILLVHGGPHHRDTWGFDPEVQWFANRGYACLQVNFRASTGYGKKFLNAGDKQWSKAMHTDLLDAIDILVAEGIADPKRVAIYGGSYGGYAALVGATFTPDVFCCAVDIFGPSNLVTLIESIPPYWTTYLKNLKLRLGDPDTERDMLESCSPLFKVDQIKAPILIAQGVNDPRVKQAESEQIVEAMKKRGIEYQYVLFPDEGHGFMIPANRLKFHAIAEKFLAQYMGGRFEE